MTSGILIAYSTKSGSTIEVAKTIGEVLCLTNEQVDVKNVNDKIDLDSYSTVILGGPMLLGWHPDSIHFVRKHQTFLSRIPVAYFITCLRMIESSEVQYNTIPIYQDPQITRIPKNRNRLTFVEKQQAVESYLSPILQKVPQVKPISVGFFGGKLDYTKLNFFHKLFLKIIIQAKAGDFRHWDAIRDWAASLKI